MSINSSPLQTGGRFKNLSKCYEHGILNHSWLIVCLVMLACAASLSYTVANLGFNTDTTEMLSPELPFHQNRIRFWTAFPKDVKSILVVIDAPSPEASRKVVDDLGSKLRAKRDIFESVYIPGEGPFFDTRGLLYLDLNELETLADRLSKVQPLIGKLARNNSLGGLLKPIGDVINDPDSPAKIDLEPLLGVIKTAFSDADAGVVKPASWQTLFTGDKSNLSRTRRFILVKARLDYSQLFPAQRPLQLIREYARPIAAEIPGASIRMTGETALQHEELESVSQGSAISAILSLLLVCTTLYIGLRSVKLMFATFLTLIAGLLLTAGFATLAVGHLNMISIAFAVLYIGLGVDYAIHLCLHYREYLDLGLSKQNALLSGIRSVGTALVLCAITSAVGFYSYIPTAYSGVSELGVISGTSMFIGLGLTLSFLPALLNLLNAPGARQAGPTRRRQELKTEWLAHARRDRIIRWSALGLALLAAISLPRVTFDFDPVHLRDANSESVRTYNDLVRDPDTSPLTLTLLESDRNRMLEISEKIRRLNTVGKVLTIDQFVPGEQEAKLDLIDQMGLILGPLPNAFPEPLLREDPVKAFDEFIRAVDTAIGGRRGSDLAPELTALRDRLSQLNRAEIDESRKTRTLKIFERNLLSGLPSTLKMLQRSLQADTIDIGDIPADLFGRWLSPDGVYRIQIFPRRDITDLENLRAFVEEVQSIAPDVTDLPVIYLEAGREVVKAFQQALLTALCAIAAVLLMVLRSIRDTVFVLIPLILAAVLTCATSVVLNLPFNFANIIAVPLLFGLGVDSGIHIMLSMRNGTYRSNGIRSNVTARGILFSALTTIFSFSSLAFSAHSGTASMGILLAIGIFFMLFCTLLVLPAFVSHIYVKPPSL
ncbi:MAG: MMPL family transporter [Gammaproteobacteria bacterium]